MQKNSLFINAFERLLFPLCLAIGAGTMFYLLSANKGNDTTVQAAYFAIPLTVMLLVLVLERIHPIEHAWNKNTGDTPTDMWSLLIVAMGLEPLMTAIGPAIAIFILLTLDLPETFSIFDGIPFWLEAILVILMIDFNKYWYHRFSHTNAFLWRFHSSHHSVKRMYLINGFRLHPLYHTATYFLAILPPLVLGASHEALIMHSVVLGIAGSFQHANIKLQHGPLNAIFSTNEVHRWHHSKKIEEGSKNCGAIFVFWDIMFGTYLLDLEGKPEEMGLHGEEFYPMNNYWRQLLVPFLWHKWMTEPMQKKANMKAGKNQKSQSG